MAFGDPATTASHAGPFELGPENFRAAKRSKEVLEGWVEADAVASP